MDFYDYFQADKGSFWQWEEQGEVIAIVGGSTIAYRGLVISLLDTMAEQGIPPFGALLLTLLVTNPNGDYILDTELTRIWHRDESSAAYLAATDDAFAFLKRLATIPERYKTGRRRLLLLQAIFADSHNSVGSKKAKALIQQFSQHQFDQHKLLTTRPSGRTLHVFELRVLALLDRRFPTVDSILKKIADLPEFLLPDEIIPETQAPADLVQALLEEPKTFEVGALIRRLWSGLAIPFQSALPSQQPIGGVSDITNKGDFGRLLLTEFANDDLIFLSRLANNEALYINREIPPASDNSQRIILIDVSLKNWGTPKIIAFAIAVAIAQHPKTTTECRVFALGTDCKALDLSTIDTIIDGLQLLSGCLHPAQGLTDYFSNHAPSGPTELFFISSPATVRLPAMQQALSQYQSRISYQFLTDSQGHIAVYRNQHSGRKHVQDITLPLAELWQNKPALARAAIGNLIAGLSGSRPKSPIKYPILFPSDLIPKRLMQTHEGEIFQINADKHLLRHYAETANWYEKGWQLMYENLPFTEGEFEMGYLHSGQHVLLLFNPQNREITVLNLSTRKLQRVTLPNWQTSPYPHFFFCVPDQVFYFMTPMHCWAINPAPTLTIKKQEQRSSAELVAMYEAREQRLKELRDSYRPRMRILKNVNSVFINEANNLVLNTHELQLLGRTVIKFKITRQPIKRHEAIAIDKQGFHFADGSRAIINRSGMLVLISSNPDIPVIYVPLVLESALGVATETDFAGVSYYSLAKSAEKDRSVQAFWQKYIVPFIKTIAQYGANP